MEAALLKIDLRGTISTRTKQLCAYADDDNSENPKSTQVKFITLRKETEKLGLIINTNKSKYMQLSRKINKTKQNIEIAGQ
jgi:hypothetical protein